MKTLEKYIKSVKTYPGADINSDHYPVVVTFKMHRFFKVKKPWRKKIDVNKMNNKEHNLGLGKILSLSYLYTLGLGKIPSSSPI